MRRNNLYLEKIIKKAIMEQDEVVPPPPKSSDEVVPNPPVKTSEPPVVYYRIVGADGNTDPDKYTAQQLKSKNLTADSLVYNKALGDWKPIKEVPELSDVLSSAPPVTQNKAPETTDSDVAAAEGFFKYCPNVAALTKTSSKDLLDKYTADINATTDFAEKERLRAEAIEKMAQSNKNDLKNCESEFKASKTQTQAQKEDVLSQYRSTINNLLRKTAADLGKKALVGGVNLATNLITKKLTGEGSSTAISANGGSGSQSGVSNTVAESLIKKNTKNHLIEIYNRKNRRRY